MTFLCQIKMNT